MLFAFAALLLHLGPSLNAVPAAAVSGSAAAKAAPAPIPDLPPAPLPSSTSASSTPSQPGPVASSGTRTQHQPSPLLRAASLGADNVAQSLSTIRIPEFQQKQAFIGVETPASRHKWLALALADHGAATFDAYSTRQALTSGARESDPLMRPFASSPGIYAAIQVCPVVLDFAARRMQRSQFGFLRHTWWLPQSLGAGAYLFSGAHNMRIANRRP